MPGETASTRKLGPIGDRILFENEYLRVWINRGGVNYLVHLPVAK